MLRKFEDGDTYLRAEHLLANGHYGKLTAKIARVVYGCPIQRRLKSCEGVGLEFVGIEKVFGLGITNESLVRVCTGESDPEKWAGHTLTLEVRMVRGPKKGTTQPAIRIIPRAGTIMRQGLIKELGEVITVPVTEPAKPKPPTLTDSESTYVADCTKEIAAAESLEALTLISTMLAKKSDAVKNVLRPLYAAKKAELTTAE